FQKLTVHRGVFHSLLGAIFFGLLTTCISHYFLRWSVLEAWFNGLFLVFGFLVHLCLDELFSVDLANGRMKKSFGTALKLFSYKDIHASIMLFIAVIALFVNAPSTSNLVLAWRRLDWINAGVVHLQIVGDCMWSKLHF
ncbi:MAG: metal-dependent hydrolase, partial [Gammaproteobacteria bacterium]